MSTWLTGEIFMDLKLKTKEIEYVGMYDWIDGYMIQYYYPELTNLAEKLNYEHLEELKNKMAEEDIYFIENNLIGVYFIDKEEIFTTENKEEAELVLSILAPSTDYVNTAKELKKGD